MRGMLKCQRYMKWKQFKLKNGWFPFQCTRSPVSNSKYLDAQYSDLEDQGKSTETLNFNAEYIF